MTVKGDFAKLAALRASLSKIASTMKPEMARLLAAEAVTQVQMGFRESRDPYGASWAPLAWRAGKPLEDTGRLRASFTANPTSSGFVVGTTTGYAKFHQYGAKTRRARGRSRARVGRLPARVMVPEEPSKIWFRGFEGVASRFVSRIFKR